MTRVRQFSTPQYPHLVAVLLAVVLLSACNSSDGSGSSNDSGSSDGSDSSNGSGSSEGNASSPKISSLSTVGSPIHPGGQVEVHVSASSPAGKSLSYAWSIPDGWDGTDNGDTLLVLTAPEEQAAQGDVTVEVSDGERSRSASVQVATLGPAIESFGVDFDDPITAGGTLGFSVDAYSRDGNPLSYHYLIGGTLNLEDRGADFEWTLDAIAMGGRYELTAIVDDGQGLTARAALETEIHGISAWPGLNGDRQRTGRSQSPDATVGEGEEVWTFSFAASSGVNLSSPAIGPDGTLYVGSDNNHVYALDPSGDDLSDEARTIWRFPTDGDVRASPAIGADGTVYVGSFDNNLYALDPSDGSMLWSFKTDGSILSSPAIGPDGTLFVGSYDNYLYALDTYPGELEDTEREIWKFPTEGEISSAPAIGADGTLYVGSWDHHVYALDPKDGSKLWSFETGEDVMHSPTIGADGTVYVSSFDNHVYALNPDPTLSDEDRELWSFEVSGAGETSPAIGADGTIYVGADDYVYAMDPDPSLDDSERKIWSFETGGPLYSSPAIGADGTVYVGSRDNHVYALDPSADEAEREIWKFPTGSRIYASPTIGADGTIYIGSFDQKLYAIH